MAGNSSSIKAGQAYILIGGDDTQLKAALDRAAAKMKALGSVVSQMGRAMLAAGTAIVTPFVAAEKVFADTGDNLYRMSQRTGIGVEQLSSLGYVAQQSGIQMGTMENGIRRMQRSLVEASQGMQQTQRAFDALGLSVSDLNGLAPDQQFQKIAVAMEKIKDPTTKAGLAMEIFGRNGAEMLPLIEQGAGAFEQLQKRAEAMGLIIGTDSARAAVVMKERIADLTDVLKNSFFRAGEAVAPMVARLVNWMTQAAVAANRWISANGPLLQQVLKIGGALVVGGASFLAVGKTIQIAAGGLKGIGMGFGLIRSSLALIAPLLTAMLNPVALVAAAMVGLGAYFLYATDTGRTMFSALGGYFGDLRDAALDAINGITDALAAGDWKLAAQIAWTGLKLEWAKGIAPLQQLWADFTYGFTKLMFEGIAGVEALWSTLTHTLSSAWISFTKAIQEAWAVLWTGLQDLANTAGLSIMQGWNTLKGHFDKSFDAAGANAALDQVMTALRVKAAQDAAQKIADVEDKARAEQIAADKAAMEERIGIMKDLSSRLAQAQGDHSADVDRIKGEIDALEKQLQTMKGQAHHERAERAFPELPPPPGIPTATGVADIISQVKVAGTFSARGAAGLAGGNIASRQLTAQEKGNKLLDTMSKNIDKMAAPLQMLATLG